MEQSGRFRGIHALTLDGKGRLALPSRYRDLLEQSQSVPLVITIDTESPCLLLYPLREWELIEVQLQALPSFQPEARRIQRLLIGHATELEIDNSGRVLVPLLLREYAHLQKNLILIGQGKRFELWDAQEWETQRTQWLEESTDKAALPEAVRGLVL